MVSDHVAPTTLQPSNLEQNGLQELNHGAFAGMEALEDL